MGECAADKHTTVLKWLQNIFGDEPVPSFRKSNAFIDHLHGLMTQECQLEIDSQAYADFITTSVHDYSDELDAITNILNRLGVSDCLTSVDVETSILASIANTLSLSTLDESSYLLSSTDLLMDKEKTTSDVNSLTKSLQEDTKHLTEAIQLGNQLEMVLEKLSRKQSDDQELTKSQSRDTLFLQNKAAKYKSDQRKQDLKLSQSGVNRSVTHEQLVADYNEIKGLDEKLQSTKEELSKFAALPPDKELAQVKLEVAKSELREIENELAKEIDIGHL